MHHHNSVCWNAPRFDEFFRVSRVGGDPLRAPNDHASSHAVVYFKPVEINLGIVRQNAIRASDVLQMED